MTMSGISNLEYFKCLRLYRNRIIIKYMQLYDVSDSIATFMVDWSINHRTLVKRVMVASSMVMHQIKNT